MRLNWPAIIAAGLTALAFGLIFSDDHLAANVLATCAVAWAILALKVDA